MKIILFFFQALRVPLAASGCTQCEGRVLKAFDEVVFKCLAATAPGIKFL